MRTLRFIVIGSLGTATCTVGVQAIRKPAVHIKLKIGIFFIADKSLSILMLFLSLNSFQLTAKIIAEALRLILVESFP